MFCVRKGFFLRPQERITPLNGRKRKYQLSALVPENLLENSITEKQMLQPLLPRFNPTVLMVFNLHERHSARGLLEMGN